MTIRVSGDTLFLSGGIDAGTADRIIQALSQNPQIRRVRLGPSPGGVGTSTVAVSNLFRERRLTVEVTGRCVSGCALLFMGGVRRTMAPDAVPSATYVAFHGNYSAGRRNADMSTSRASAIVRMSGGRMPMALATEITSLEREGFAAFFHPKRYRRTDGATVAWCVGTERRRPADCQSRRGVDGITVGVFTE